MILVGPTAIGKTDLAITIAQQLGKEIISADSRQVYTHMDIGTAKPSAEQVAAVPHHFISIKTPDEYYSAGQYATEARQVIAELIAAGSPPVVVGGSGLYIRALVDGFFEPKIADAEVKKRLQASIDENGLAPLYARLQKIDPATAQRLQATDKQRILRALEVYEITERPFSEFQQMQNCPADFQTSFVGLTMDRQKLYRRIEKRVDQMLEDGLLQEVQLLLEMGYTPHLNALKTVGYQEAFAYLENKISLDEMTRMIKQKSRNYAKRQYTWFRKDKRIHWIDLDEVTELEDRVAEVVRLMHTE